MSRREPAFEVPRHGFHVPVPRSLRTKLASLAVAALIGMTALVGLGPQLVSAALAAAGPVDPANGYPTWYQDTTGAQLVLCANAADPLCGGLFVPPNPGLPASFPANWPDEAFYYMASTDITAGAVTAFWEGALEAAFVNGPPAAGEQIVFGRVRIRIDGLTPSASYTVTHPYGENSFVADALGSINFTRDIGVVPGFFSGPLSATTSDVGPFLRQVTPAPPAGALGDGVSLATVTGSPTGNNLLRVVGPNVGGLGVNQIQTNFFTVVGKLFVPPPPPQVTAAIPGMYQQDSTSIRMLGAAWNTFAWTGANGGSFAASSNVGDTAAFLFDGTAVRWHTIAAFNRGTANILVDGVLHSTVNNNAPGVAPKVVDIQGLAAGVHTVTIQAAGGGFVDVDAFELVGPPPGPLVPATVPGPYQQDAASIRLTGAWTTYPWTGASGGSFAASSTAGDVAEFAFTGTGVRWHTIAAFNRGSAQVFIDGVLNSTVNNNAPGVATKIVDILGLAAGTHTLRIQVVGGGFVDVDVLELVTGAAPPPPPAAPAGLYQESSPSITFTGTWTTYPWTGANGGAFSASVNAGDAAEIRFTGTGVRWSTIAAFNRGSAQVFVDGVLNSTVNNNAPGVATKIVDILGLAAGTHTLRIQVVGGGFVDVDALQVQ